MFSCGLFRKRERGARVWKRPGMSAGERAEQYAVSHHGEMRGKGPEYLQGKGPERKEDGKNGGE